MMAGEMGGEGGDEGGAARRQGDTDQRPNDAVVELCGVICIFNPPDSNKLGTGTASALAARSRGIPTSGAMIPTQSSGGGM